MTQQFSSFSQNLSTAGYAEKHTFVRQSAGKPEEQNLSRTFFIHS